MHRLGQLMAEAVLLGDADALERVALASSFCATASPLCRPAVASCSTTLRFRGHAGKIQSRLDLPIMRDDQRASAIFPRRRRAACAWRCACESDTLGAVAIMVKSERRGDRIISAFTGREAPAGSCRGSMAEGFPRTRANPCDAKIKPGPGVAGCGGRSVVAYKIGSRMYRVNSSQA